MNLLLHACGDKMYFFSKHMRVLFDWISKNSTLILFVQLWISMMFIFCNKLNTEKIIFYLQQYLANCLKINIIYDCDITNQDESLSISPSTNIALVSYEKSSACSQFFRQTYRSFSLIK